MQKLKKMITDAGYDANLGWAVAMATGYFKKEERENPKKNYSVQEVKDLMGFLFGVRTNELDTETKAAIQTMAELEMEFDSGKDDACSAQQK